MSLHELSAGEWTELVEMGGATCKSIIVTAGQALVSVGDPEGESFHVEMSAHGHRKNIIGPLVPVYARALSPGATVSVGGVGDEEPAYLPGDQAIVTDGQELLVDGGTVTLAVADGVVTAEYVADE